MLYIKLLLHFSNHTLTPSFLYRSARGRTTALPPVSCINVGGLLRHGIADHLRPSMPLLISSRMRFFPTARVEERPKKSVRRI